MEPLYEVLKLGSEKNTFSEKFVVEKTTSLSEAEVKKVLSVSVGTFTGDTALVGDRITYSGRVVFYVCYLDFEGVLKKAETSSDYSREYKVENPDGICAYTVSVNCGKTDHSFESGVLTLKAYLTADGTITTCQNVSVFSGGENIVSDRAEIGYSKSFGQKNATYPLEEEFDLNYQVKDVITQNLDAVITNAQCGVGSIIVDGEVYLRCLLLQNVEKSDIIKEERTIPFRVEIECDEAMPQMTSTASVSVGGLKTDISVDENTNKSSVSVSVNLAFTGEAFAEEKAEILNDVFSTTEELEIEKNSGVFYLPEKIAVCEAKASGRVILDELPVGTRVTATCDEKFDLVSFSCEDSFLTIDGALGMKIYLKDGDGNAFCVKAETPVSFVVDCPIRGCEEKSVYVCAKNSYARLISLTETEIGATLSISVKACEKKEFAFINKVKSVGEKKPCDASISVYIPTSGEELWSLSKRLGICPEKLIETNKDLQFPLTGKERIVIYRQK